MGQALGQWDRVTGWSLSVAHVGLLFSVRFPTITTGGPAMRTITLLALILTACGTVEPPCECDEAVRAYHDCYDAGGNVDDCDEPARWVREACLGDEEEGR